MSIPLAELYQLQERHLETVQTGLETKDPEYLEAAITHFVNEGINTSVILEWIESVAVENNIEWSEVEPLVSSIIKTEMFYHDTEMASRERLHQTLKTWIDSEVVIFAGLINEGKLSLEKATELITTHFEVFDGLPGSGELQEMVEAAFVSYFNQPPQKEGESS